MDTNFQRVSMLTLECILYFLSNIFQRKKNVTFRKVIRHRMIAQKVPRFKSLLSQSWLVLHKSTKESIKQIHCDKSVFSILLSSAVLLQ